MILERNTGQELLDMLSALSLGASTLLVARWGPASSLRSRLIFIFGGLCAFFAIRAAGDALASTALETIDRLIACVMPLAALLLVEGALRRHAPKAIKAFVSVGALVVAVALLIPSSRNAATNYGLGAFVILSLVCVTALLVTRDRSSLSRQENAGLDALAVPGALMTLLTITDFVGSTPVGLSGIGAAMLAFVLAANASSRREVRAVLTELVLITLVTVASEPAFAAALAIETPAQHVRMAAVLVALTLATSAVLRVRQAREERTTQSFARALTLADISSVDRFLNSLADQPLLAGLHLAEDGQLAEYDRGGLGTALAQRSFWTRDVLRDSTVSIAKRAREELDDLMTRTDATHAVALSHAPLRIALFTLPRHGRAGNAETDLALFGKFAAIAAREHVCV